jgi:predicted phage replisome organizer
MAEVKWIKIVTDIFNDEKILLIESMPEADAIIVIWFKLLCMAGKQNNSGVFLMNGRIAYTDEMFATIFRRPLNIVRMALKTFEQFGMIEIINDTVTIPNWGKHQQLDGIELSREKTRVRVAAYRAKQRQLMETNQCQYCGKPATGYDHIIPISRGGTDTEDNKVPCCIECNRIKNDKPLIDFLNGNRDRINDEIVMANEKIARHVTLCNVTGCYTVTPGNADRIDKNREEKKREDTKNPSDSCAEPEKPASTPQEPTVFTLPLNDGTEHRVTQADFDKYESLYPAVDVMQELRKMAGWLDGNPKNRKTKSGIRRFINSWLARAQDQGNAKKRKGSGGSGPGFDRSTSEGYVPLGANDRMI